MNGSTHDTYPQTWKDFVGQDLAKRQLMVAVASSKKRNKPLDHILLASGTPGIGKTALALLVASSRGVRVTTISGKVTNDQMRTVVAKSRTGTNSGSIIFIDEIHTLGKADWLLHVLQDGVLMGPTGPEVLPPLTIIGATTDAGRLPEPVLQRFPITPTLVPYTVDEAARIARNMALTIMEGLPQPTPRVVAAIAKAANNNPRVIRGLLINLRDLNIVGRKPRDGNYDLAEALLFAGLTLDGLTAQALRYLKIMGAEFNGKAGQHAIADRLQEPGGLQYTERLLMDAGLMAKTGQGRMLTNAGLDRALEGAA